jgi:cytohesin
MSLPTSATDLNDRLWNSFGRGGGLAGVNAALEYGADSRCWSATAEGDLEGVKAALEDGANVAKALDGALLKGKPDIVSLLIQRGANVNIAGRGGDSPLVNAIMAIGTSDPDKVRIAGMLIAAGANIRRADSKGQTPIHWAVTSGKLEIVKLLLEKGADINGLTANRETPLDLAENTPIADYLLTRGARIGGISANGERPLADVDRELFMAAIAGDAERVRQAVARGGHVNIRDSLQRSPLYRAAQLGRLEASKALLDKGADLALPGSLDRRTPLQVAAGKGYAKLIELFLARGAKINATDAGHGTPLKAATNAEAAAVLLRAGADANEGLCPLFGPDDGKLVELLLSYGADANAQCGHDTPLLRAIIWWKWDIASILLDHGADPNDTGGSEFSTPLGVAAGNGGNAATVARLLERGANPNTPDKYGITPLIEAARYGQRGIVQLLLDRGANVELRGPTGVTALAAANDAETADLLISRGANVDDLIPGLLGRDARLDDDQRALFRAVVTDSVRGTAAAISDLADVSKQFPGGLTPLVLATTLARINVTDWLLEHGANANARDADGMAPLHRAVIAFTRDPQQKIRLIRSLLKHGASIDVIENRYGMTPLHLAAATFNKDVADFLLRNGANPVRRTKQGYTPMQLAQRSTFGTGWGGSPTQEDLKQKSATIEALRTAVITRPIEPSGLAR